MNSGVQFAWARGWVESFRNSKKEPVHVIVLSDSTAHVDQNNGIGYGPDERANLWPNQLQAALSRIAPGHSNGTGLLTLEANAGRYDTDVWQVSEPYSYNPCIGPAQPCLRKGGVVPANGGTVCLKANTEASLASQYGDTLWIYWACCKDSAAFTVEVDDSSVGSFGHKYSPSCKAERTCVFHGALGRHAVKIKAGSGNAYLYASEWTIGNAGVAVDNLAVGGATTAFFSSSQKLAFVHTIPNVGLAIVALGINDFAHGISLASYRSGLSAIIEDFSANFPKASILIVSQYPILGDNIRGPLGLMQSQYFEIAQQTAAKYHVGYLDLGQVWGGTFAAVDKLGIFTSDKVHPSDTGGQRLSMEIQRAIVDPIWGGP